MFDFIELQTEVDKSELRLFTSEFLYREGDKANYIYCIKEGKLVAFKENKHSKNVLINFVKPGQVLGLSALSNGVYQHSVKTLSDTLVNCVPSHIIMENIQKEFDFKLAVMQKICKEANAMDRKSLKIHNRDTKQRIAMAIMDMLDTFGMDAQQNINLQYPMQELANFLGLSKRNFNKALEELHAHGFIQLKNQEIKILDLEGVQILAQ